MFLVLIGLGLVLSGLGLAFFGLGLGHELCDLVYINNIMLYSVCLCLCGADMPGSISLVLKRASTPTCSTAWVYLRFLLTAPSHLTRYSSLRSLCNLTL